LKLIILRWEGYGTIITKGLLCQALWSLVFLFENFKISGEKMENCFKSLHVISSIVFNIMLLIITFTTENPIILLGVLACCILVFYFSGNIKSLFNGLIVFIPFFIITIVINLLFVQQGRIILFTLGSRHFTLEALMYAVILSSKLLIVIYIFQMLGIMMDSDRAVSYFSSLMPKSTLTFMIALKLFPLMKRRISSLREIYSIRGVDFEGKSIRDKVLAYKPVLSVLLEDSLEKSFDIGEAVFVRGFLSTKRTIYDRRPMQTYDWLLSITCFIIIFVYLGTIILGITSYDFYTDDLIKIIFNKGVYIVMALFALLYGELTFIRKRLVVKDELY
jgi:energy-coupling factor transport system permease protein